jgi:hypothetical protein
MHGGRRGGVEAGLAGVLLICGGAATTGSARLKSGDDGSTGLKSTAMLKSSHSKSESAGGVPLGMATGKSPSGINPPSPSPRGQNFPIPANTREGRFVTILVPAGDFVPDGSPSPRNMHRLQTKWYHMNKKKVKERTIRATTIITR